MFEKQNGGLAIDEPLRCSVNEPVDHSQESAFCYSLPALYKPFCYSLPALYKPFRLLFECPDSTFVFTFLCNYVQLARSVK
jgi:hypothetical protein